MGILSFLFGGTSENEDHGGSIEQEVRYAFRTDQQIRNAGNS